MNGYFCVLTTIDFFVLCFMCILTYLSETLSKKQKRGFFLAFVLIAGISALEVITLVVDGLPPGYRWLNITANYLGFGLSPDMIADFKACGGFLLLATGFRIAKIHDFPVADMIPAMVLVMPASWFWVNMIVPVL